MSKATIKNMLYTHLHGEISRARQLEYAIRATQRGSPDDLLRLTEIDSQIRQRWVDIGLTKDEVNRESVMDLTWDMVQVGDFLSRQHSRKYPPELLRDIQKGLEEIPPDFQDEVRCMQVPASRIFRICDLLNGNNIGKLLGRVASALEDARQYSSSDEIELSKFVLGIRDPIPIHPAFRYVDCHEQLDEHTVERFGFALDTRMPISVPEIMRQMHEYLYQYAMRKQALGFKDEETDGLIQHCLEAELKGDHGEAPALRADGFLRFLSGLYCWDRVQLHVGDGYAHPLSGAITDTLDIYPGDPDNVVTPEAIKDNCYKTDKAINNYFARFYPARKFVPLRRSRKKSSK